MNVERAEVTAVLPPVPMTVEGASVLHQMLRFRRSEWKALPAEKQREIADEVSARLAKMEQESNGQSAIYSLLGHKGDLLLIHFRNSFEELKQAELDIQNLALADYLEPVSSYLSVVELGLYEATSKTYARLAEQGLQPGTAEWDSAIEEVLAQHRKAMAPRLWPKIPERRYVCFYPMDRKRGEEKNWYLVPMADRQRMMHEHGLIGRRYADHVRQIITGSIGFDDWEWGVDLFADDPLIFKKLIYEMRFDEASAVYALFGSFYVGVRVPAAELGRLLAGELPSWSPKG
jgi:Uncharacterized conserved protein